MKPSDPPFQKFYQELMKADDISDKCKLLEQFIGSHCHIGTREQITYGDANRDRAIPFSSDLYDYVLYLLWWKDKREYTLTMFAEEKAENMLGERGEIRYVQEFREKGDNIGFFRIAWEMIQLEAGD